MKFATTKILAAALLLAAGTQTAFASSVNKAGDTITNTASVQLVPATMIGVLAAAGSQNPTAIIGSSIAAGAIGTVAAVQGVTVSADLPGIVERIAFESGASVQQGDLLVQLVKLYLDRWRPELADEALAKIRTAGPDKITFAWAGGLDRSKQTYYRIQGPTFLIEFDNFQGNGNHIHTTVRDLKGDFGHDLLREHYAKQHKS